MLPRRRSDETVPGVDHEEILEPPDVRDVLVARENETDAGPLETLDRVARVVDDVALAPGSGNREQMMVQHEDLELRGRGCELLLDPAVAPAPDLAMVEVGLARVDGDDRDRPLLQHGVSLAEHLLEVHVADVPRVVVAGDDDESAAVDAIEVLARGEVLVTEAECRQVAGADHDVRLELVDLPDRALEQARFEVRLAAVEVGELRDPEHSRSLRPVQASSEAVSTLAWVREESSRFPGILRQRAPAVREPYRGRVREDPRLLRHPVGLRAALVRPRA